MSGLWFKVEMGISEENYTPWKTNLEEDGPLENHCCTSLLSRNILYSIILVILMWYMYIHTYILYILHEYLLFLKNCKFCIKVTLPWTSLQGKPMWYTCRISTFRWSPLSQRHPYKGYVDPPYERFPGLRLDVHQMLGCPMVRANSSLLWCRHQRSRDFARDMYIM